jgi:ankyrin repeat protein
LEKGGTAGEWKMATVSDVLQVFRTGDLERLKALLILEPSLADARDEVGVSLLLHARYRSRMEMVELLLASRKELDIFEAAALGQGTRVAALLDGDPTRVRAFSGDGFTALHLAAFFAQPHAVALLLGRGADANVVAKNPSAVTPLHSAAAGRSLDALRLLLMRGANPNARQQGGFTPLHAAALHGDLPMVLLLLGRGALPSAASDDGKTPLQLAEEKGHTTVAELIKAPPTTPADE